MCQGEGASLLQGLVKCTMTGNQHSGMRGSASEREAPQSSPEGEAGDGSGEQRGAADDIAATLPTAHLHNPLAEASNEDMRGLI